MKMRRTRKQTAPRNLAARALRTPLFAPRVTRNPKAYRRTAKQKPAIPEDDAED